MKGAAIEMNVTFGEGVAVIRQRGRSEPVVAGVLGIEREGSTETVFLDRLVHRAGQEWNDWSASGAISTILTRALPADETNQEKS